MKNLGVWVAICLVPIAMTCVMHNHLHSYGGRHGIFTPNRSSRYFLNLPKLEAPCRKIAADVSAHHIRQVGIIMSANDLEYPLDVLLKQVDASIRVERVPQPGLPNPRTLNKGWDSNLRPALIVKIEKDSATEVEVLEGQSHSE